MWKKYIILYSKKIIWRKKMRKLTAQENHEKVTLLVQFFNKFDRMPKSNEVYENRNLGNLFYKLKASKICISEDDKMLLEELGCYFSLESVKEKLKVVLEFFSQKSRMPYKEEVFKNIEIEKFYRALRNDWVTISEEERLLLKANEIPLKKDDVYQRNHEKVLVLVEFYEKFGRLPITKEIYNGVNIYTFLKKINLDPFLLQESDWEILRKIGANKLSRKKAVHQKVMLLKEYYEKYQREPASLEIYKGERVGTFLIRIRSKNTIITEADAKLLIETGYDLENSYKTKRIHQKVLLLEEFYKENNKAPSSRVEFKGEKIGLFYKWITYSRIKITAEDRKLLESVGYDFLTRKQRVHLNTVSLEKYYNTYKKFPERDEKYNNYKIGEFYYKLRNSRIVISKDDKKILLRIGIVA
jgi:hypothetical protein